MRTLAILLLAVALPAQAYLPSITAAKRTVHLNRPGVLEALQRSDPETHRRVLAIVTLAHESPCQMDEFARVTRVEFDARNARCGMVVKTSYPAKLELSFELGDTRYLSIVTMKATERLVPAKP
jgi:hypothetical protein